MKRLLLTFIFALFLVGCFFASSGICADTGQLISVNEDRRVDPSEVVYTFTFVNSSELILPDNSSKQSGVAITLCDCSSCHRGLTDWHPFTVG